MAPPHHHNTHAHKRVHAPRAPLERGEPLHLLLLLLRAPLVAHAVALALQHAHALAKDHVLKLGDLGRVLKIAMVFKATSQLSCSGPPAPPPGAPQL